MIHPFKWFGIAFSDNGTPSSSRFLTLLHSLCAIGVVVNYSKHNNGGIPDVAVLGGLAAFATVHYVVNRTTQGFGQPKDTPEVK